MYNSCFNTLTSLEGTEYKYYSLPKLAKQLEVDLSRLPICIRIMLESILRNCDGKRIKKEDVEHLAHGNREPLEYDIPFVVARVLLQDFTGVPLLVDLAAMRDAMAKQGLDPKKIEPIVPVELVIDHSVQVDRSGTPDAFLFNLEIEFQRNRERYEFLSWGEQAFKTVKIIPPGIGIVHQINLEHLATIVIEKDKLLYFDTVVGTDSHTTMVNGLGVLGWGVGGIEAEAAMLGQPYFLQAPEVIGVYLSGKLLDRVTATDLTLRITELLRSEKVVDKFIEFFGEGSASLTLADRATIGNMAPEYGATIGFFPTDDQTMSYLQMTGRTKEEIERVKQYLQAQEMYGMPLSNQIDYTRVIELDLSSVKPCIAGPKRPQDRIDLEQVKKRFNHLFLAPVSEGGYGKKAEDRKISIATHSDGNFHLYEPHIMGGTPYVVKESSPTWSETEMVTNRPLNYSVINPGYTQHSSRDIHLKHGSIVIAAITSCTNTSNPSVMIGAGLIAKKAVEKGLQVNRSIKTSLAPGSRVVTDYLRNAGLQKYLDVLGFNLVAYGCTTCIGNSGPLDEKIENAIKQYDLIVASVLSGNRNFEARIHGSVKANFLMSPPLVVAYALVGNMDIDFEKDPLGYDLSGSPVFLADIWPSAKEIKETIFQAMQPEMFKKRYKHILEDNPLWKKIEKKTEDQYAWDKKSTYIQCPPFFEHFSKKLPARPNLTGMRPLALFGDSITTDHISPAGAFRASSSAGKYLIEHGVNETDFNSYGSRRGNHHIMMRGTFANVRIRNQMLSGKEGGFTKLMPEGKEMQIFEACQKYAERKVPLIIFAGSDYGMGSSRDWAAKGIALLGVHAVIARSFERIHRSNLVGMGVLPLQFQENDSWESFQINGTEIFDLVGLEKECKPHQNVILKIYRENGLTQEVSLLVRIDSSVEVDYYLQGGILPYVLRQILT